MGTLKPVLKLKEEQREVLAELFSGQGWPTLLTVLDQLVRRRGDDVLTIESPDRLLKAKNEYDGAKSLASDIKRLKELLKISPEE